MCFAAKVAVECVEGRLAEILLSSATAARNAPVRKRLAVAVRCATAPKTPRSLHAPYGTNNFVDRQAPASMSDRGSIISNLGGNHFAPVGTLPGDHSGF